VCNEKYRVKLKYMHFPFYAIIKRNYHTPQKLSHLLVEGGPLSSGLLLFQDKKHKKKNTKKNWVKNKRPAPVIRRTQRGYNGINIWNTKGEGDPPHKGQATRQTLRYTGTHSFYSSNTFSLISLTLIFL
jgi:hypothetical protein